MSVNRTVFLPFFVVVLMLYAGPTSAGAQSSRAADGGEPGFTIEPYTRAVLGSTEYVLQAPGVQSRLEFPLNMLVLGLSGEYALRSEGREDWRFQMSAGTSVSGPWGVLKDHDWYLVEDVPPIKFSYTESDAELFFFEARAGVEKRVFSAPDAGLFGRLGYDFQYISQNALGFSGWQYVQDPNASEDDDYVYAIAVKNSDQLALEYTVVYHRLAAGAVLRWQPYRSFELELGLLPQLMYVADRDDHVLRNKLSTAAGFGGGVESELSLTYRWHENPDYQSYVSVSGGLLYLRAVAEQTQEWYGDDPGTAGDDTGQKYTGITHIIQTLQGSLGVSAGVWYR
ncbi:MAG: hypothetical protein ACOC2R_03755 [Spirochaetota bacterium]